MLHLACHNNATFGLPYQSRNENFYEIYWNHYSESIEFGGLFKKWCSQRTSLHFLKVQSKFSGDSCYMSLALKKVVAYQIYRSWFCSLAAATSQHLKVGNCAAKLLPRVSKAAQRFCIPLQLELSCCLASKVLVTAVIWLYSCFEAILWRCTVDLGVKSRPCTSVYLRVAFKQVKYEMSIFHIINITHLISH